MSEDEGGVDAGLEEDGMGGDAGLEEDGTGGDAGLEEDGIGGDPCLEEDDGSVDEKFLLSSQCFYGSPANFTCDYFCC